MANTQKLNPEDIKDLYLTQGLSTIEIAKAKECSVAGVKAVLRKLGVPMRSCGGRRTVKAVGFLPNKTFMENAMAAFKGVASDAAKHYKVKYATWIDWLERFDIPRQTPGTVLKGRPSHRRHDLPVDRAIKLSNEGRIYQQIADTFKVSVGVVNRRMAEAGHKAPKRREKDLRFGTVSYSKRKVLQQLGITACEICGEDRALDYCHIKSAAKGGPIHAANCLVLCPTHHRVFDNQQLLPHEAVKIKKRVAIAAHMFGLPL